MTDSLVSVLADTPSETPFSSEMHKKIRRNHFKKDVAIKSYKCQFDGPDHSTQAKLYVSSCAFHIVHRPRRRKLTTIPFIAIDSIIKRLDGRSLDLRITNGPCYVLTKFERFESAIAFILNFWNLVRKDKLLSQLRTGSPRSTSTDYSSSTEPSVVSVEACLPFRSNLNFTKGPTTVSLNSSASTSESESVDSRRSPNSSLHTRNLTPTSETSRVSASQSVRSASPHLRCHKVPNNSVISDRLGTVSGTLIAAESTDSAQPVTSVATLSPSSAFPLRISSDCAITQRSHQTPVLHATSPIPLIISGPQTSCIPTIQSSVISRSPVHSSKPKAVGCLNEAPDWSIWPFTFLPYPLVSPPQRLTMMIAYAILAFLLFSTVYLYHRQAMLRPHTGATLHLDYSTSASEYAMNLKTLETQLSQLVDLVDQLTRSLVQLTTELQSVSFEPDPTQTDPAPSTPTS